MRRGSIVAIVVIGVIAGGVATAVALVPTWLPVDASREAGRIDFVFWFVIAICIAIFALVAAVIIYAVLHFRVQEDDFEDGPPVHGHTGLEITWTVIPFVLVTSIAIVSAIVLSRNDAQAQDTLRVNVTAQQFAFTFGYPDAKNVTSPVLRLPKDRSVELYMRALDVIHSVFVPQFGQKEDIVPGLVTQLHITPDRLGTFPLECTELCGLGHSLMRSEAIVMTPTAFDHWLKHKNNGIEKTPNVLLLDVELVLVLVFGVRRLVGLQREQLRELPHAGRRPRHGHGRPGPRQARRIRAAGAPAAHRLRPRVDRQPRRVRAIGISEGPHAAEFRADDREVSTRRSRDVPRPIRPASEQEGMNHA